MRYARIWSAKGLFLAALLPGAAARADFSVRDASCTNASNCTVQFPVSSSTVSYPRQLSCYWSQNEGSPALRRVLLGHQPTGLPVVPTLALPIQSHEAAAMAFNLSLQPGALLAIKGGRLNAQFDWGVAVTATIKCTYVYTK